MTAVKGSGIYPSTVPSRLQAAHLSMLDAWRHSVQVRAEKPAVHYFDQTFTFGEIDTVSDALAAAFQAHDVSPGDRIAIYLQNDPQWLVTLLAAWKCGAVVACVNPMLRAGELQHHLADAKPRLLVCLDSLYADVVMPIRDTLPVQTIITTHPWDMARNQQEPAAFARSWGPRRTFADALNWTTIQNEYAGAELAAVRVHGDDVALLTYTSGTTGPAKGAMNLHSGLAHNAEVFARWFDIQADRDVILTMAPLFHITGSVAGMALGIASGAPVVLLHRFDARLILEAIERHQATFTIGASTAYTALSSHPDLARYDVTSLTKVASGGAPTSISLIDRVRKLTGWTLTGVYGLTETTSPATLVPPHVEPPIDPDSGVVSVGIAVPGAVLRILDEGGSVLPAGSVGEIAVSGPMVIPGYWNAPDESSRSIPNGELLTGDVGKVDKDGWLFVVDRKKDQINAGGYKIWPREVEDVLQSHPAVREAAVVGVADGYRGETVKAVVSLREGATVSVDDLIAFSRENMAAYKYPRILEIVSDLPKNASGKILRRELRTTETS